MLLRLIMKKSDIHKNTFSFDHFHNDVSFCEMIPGTSLASMLCGSKSQKRALLSATHKMALNSNLQHNRSFSLQNLKLAEKSYTRV